jgi:bilin biosynthesis protein
LIVGLFVNSLGADEQVAYIDADILYNNDIKVWIYPKIVDENNTFDVLAKTCMIYIELLEIFPEIQDLQIEVDVPLSDRPIFSLGTANCLKEWTYGTKNADETWNVDSFVALMEKVGSSGRRRAYDTNDETKLTATTCTFNMNFPNIGHINPYDYYCGAYCTGDMGVGITLFGGVYPSPEQELPRDNLTRDLSEITDSLNIPYIIICDNIMPPIGNVQGAIFVHRIYEDGEGRKGDSALNINEMMDAIKMKATQDGYICELIDNQSNMTVLMCTNNSNKPDLMYFAKYEELMHDKLYEYGYFILDKFGQKEAYITLSTLTINETTYALHECHGSALGETNSKKTIAPLTSVLNDTNDTVRDAVEAIKKFKILGNIDLLSNALNASAEEYLGSNDGAHIRNTVENLGLMDEPRSIDLLILALKNNTDRGGPYLYDILDTLEEIGTPAVDPLINVLLDDNVDSDRRALAVEALGDIGDPKAIDPLIQILNKSDCDSCYQDAITVALGRLGDAAVSPLILALKEGDSRTKIRVAYVLGYLENTQAIEPLKELLKDEDPDVREVAAWQLEVFGVQATTGNQSG